jgi:hypothetical protein
MRLTDSLFQPITGIPVLVGDNAPGTQIMSGIVLTRHRGSEIYPR